MVVPSRNSGGIGLSTVNLEFVIVRLVFSSRAELRRCLEEAAPIRSVFNKPFGKLAFYH